MPTLRRRLGGGLAVTAAGLAALAFAPQPTYALWYAHAAALETSLVPALLGTVAALLAWRGPRWALGCAGLGAVAGLLPFAVALPAFQRESIAFSPAEYLFARIPLPDLRVERDLRLDPARPELRADVYRGLGVGPRPLVVVVHGGSWRGGDKGAAAHVSGALAATGFTVADVQYRFAPDQRFPAQVGDVKCLLGRLRELGEQWGIDRERVALLGRSAGGQIALLAAYSAGDARVPPSCAVEDRPAQAVVSLYAPTDLVWGHDQPLRPDVVRGPESLELYLGGPPAAQPDAYRLGSPLSWAHRPLPPTLLIHGAADRLVSAGHAERLAAGLMERGRPVRLLLPPLGEHGFDVRPGGLGEQLARGVTLRFLRETLGS